MALVSALIYFWSIGNSCFQFSIITPKENDCIYGLQTCKNNVISPRNHGHLIKYECILVVFLLKGIVYFCRPQFVQHKTSQHWKQGFPVIQRPLSHPCCLLKIIRLTSMLLLVKTSFPWSMVAAGRDRVRPRIQAKSTWNSLKTSVHEYTSAEFS